jgi:hypothetical protein
MLDHKEEKYRVRVVDLGHTYALIQIQCQVGMRKKYFFFGAEVPRWEYLGNSRYDHFPAESFKRKSFYETSKVKALAIKAIESHNGAEHEHEPHI